MATVQIEVNDTSEVRYYLANWGSWARQTPQYNLNYPVRGDAKHVPYDAADAELIEAILTSQMRIENRVYYNVILQEYYFQSTIRDGADKLRMGRTEYSQNICKAESYIQGYLHAIRCFGGVGRCV